MIALLFACLASVLSQYHAERETIVVPATSHPAAWVPDVELSITLDAVESLVKATTDAALKTKALTLGPGVKLKPELSVRRLDLTADARCAGCFHLDAKLKGRAVWTAGPLKGEVPLSVKLGGSVQFKLSPAGDGWRLEGRLVDISTLEVGPITAARLDATTPVRTWALRRLDAMPPLVLGTVGGAGLPLRAVRLEGKAGVLSLAMLTDLQGGGHLAPATDGPRADWRLRIAPETLTGLMRRRAFAEEPIRDPLTLVPDPRHFTLQGTDFTLDLRIWGLDGRGWWRDYRVTGGVVVKKKIRLQADTAESLANSRGAALVDVLALAAEGKILAGLEDAVQAAMPARKGIEIAGNTIVAKVSGISGGRGVVRVQGSLRP